MAGEDSMPDGVLYDHFALPFGFNAVNPPFAEAAKVPPADERWRQTMLKLIGVGIAAESLRKIQYPASTSYPTLTDLLADLGLTVG